MLKTQNLRFLYIVLCSILAHVVLLIIFNDGSHSNIKPEKDQYYRVDIKLNRARRRIANYNKLGKSGRHKKFPDLLRQLFPPNISKTSQSYIDPQFEKYLKVQEFCKSMNQSAYTNFKLPKKLYSHDVSKTAHKDLTAFERMIYTW